MTEPAEQPTPPTSSTGRISPRTFAGIVGGVLLLVGLLGLLIPVTVDRSGGGSINCGTAMTGLSDDPGYADGGKAVADAMYPGFADDSEASYEEQCEDGIGARRVWSWPLAGIGVIAVLGAAAVQSPRRPGGETTS